VLELQNQGEYKDDCPEVRFFFLLQVKTWVKELKKMLGSEMCLIIAGNKVDLEKQRNVSVEDAEE
jgi:GTPase SAR1 family protein